MTKLCASRSIICLILVAQVTAAALPHPVVAADSASKQILLKAHALLDKNQAKAALVLVNELIRKEPKNTEAYCERAFAYRALGQNQKSLQDSTKAVQLSYWKPRPFVERGHTYIHLRQYFKAIENCTSAIQLDPQYCDAYRLRADAYERLGFYNKQIGDLSSAIYIQPKDADLYERRARAYFQVGQLQKTIDDTNAAIKLSASSQEAYGTAARAEESLGSHAKAIEHLTKCVTLDPKNASAWGYKAIIENLAGRHELASSDWQKALSLGSPEVKMRLQLYSPCTDIKNLSESPRELIAKQLKAGPVVLPFHYDDEGHMHLPMQVNGHTVEMMLDTGCDHSELWKDKMAGIATIKEEQGSRCNAQGIVTHYGWFRAQSLKLGQVILPNVALEVGEGLVGHRTISGFLGGNILENFVVSIDYPNKQVILSSSVDPITSKTAFSVPMWLINHLPHCAVKLDGKLDLSALLDTGDPTNRVPDSLLPPLLSKRLSFKELSGGPWLGELHVETIRLNGVSLGPTSIPDPIFEAFQAVEAPAAASSITLGCSFLSRFKKVTFDYPGRRVFFQPIDVAYVSASQNYSEGMFYASRHEQQKAVEAFTRCMKLDADYAASCYFRRGWARMQLKEYKQAIEDLNEAIRLDPTDHWSYELRAWINGRLGEHKLAIADFTKAIQLSPNLPQAYRHRASSYEELGLHELARKDRKTLELLESQKTLTKAK